MESKGKRRDRKIGALLIILVIGFLIGLYTPMVIQSFKSSPSTEYAQSNEVHGKITHEQEVDQTVSARASVTYGACVYFIQKGDTLTEIAKRTNDTVQAIAERNRIKDVNRISAGKGIKIKESGGSCVVVSKTSSKKFTGHAGASQKTLFTNHSQKPHASVRAGKTTLDNAVAHKNVNCMLVGSRAQSYSERLVARAECIRTHYGSMIAEAVVAEGNHFSTLEILAIMLQESQGNPRAVSTARVPCLGLMQLQPPTARQYGVEDIFDPRQNIFGGVRVFTDYVYRYGKGDKSYGLAAYNMGPEGLRKSRLNPYRMTYVREVKAILRILEDRQFTL